MVWVRSKIMNNFCILMKFFYCCVICVSLQLFHLFRFLLIQLQSFHATTVTELQTFWSCKFHWQRWTHKCMNWIRHKLWWIIFINLVSRCNYQSFQLSSTSSSLLKHHETSQEQWDLLMVWCMTFTRLLLQAEERARSFRWNVINKLKTTHEIFIAPP